SRKHCAQEKKSGRTTLETSPSSTRSIDTDTKGSDRCDAVLVLEQREHKPDRGPEGHGQEGGGGDYGRERSCQCAGGPRATKEPFRGASYSSNREMYPGIFGMIEHRLEKLVVQVTAPVHVWCVILAEIRRCRFARAQILPEMPELSFPLRKKGSAPTLSERKGPPPFLGYRVGSAGL